MILNTALLISTYLISYIHGVFWKFGPFDDAMGGGNGPLDDAIINWDPLIT